MCTCLCLSISHFGTHHAHILWYLGSSCMMEYADPQLTSNLSATISDSNPSVLLNKSITLFNNVCYSNSGHTKQSSSETNILPLQNHSIHWYTFLCKILFFCIMLTFACEYEESFYPFDHKNWMRAHCLPMVQNKYFETIIACTSLNVTTIPWHTNSVCSMCDVCKINMTNCPYFWFPFLLTCNTWHYILCMEKLISTSLTFNYHFLNGGETINTQKRRTLLKWPLQIIPSFISQHIVPVFPELCQNSSAVKRWATGCRTGGVSPTKGLEFFCLPPNPDQLLGPPSLLSNGYQGLYLWGRICGAIPPLPQYIFMACGSVKKYTDNFTFTLTFTHSNTKS